MCFDLGRVSVNLLIGLGGKLRVSTLYKKGGKTREPLRGPSRYHGGKETVENSRELGG